MSDFDLDLRGAEDRIESGEEPGSGDVVLGELDGSTDPAEWVAAVEDGEVLLLAVDGDLNELAAPFARDVKEMGGTLMHFRDMLVVVPPGVEIDTGRLG